MNVNGGELRDRVLPNMPQLDALRALAVLAVMYQHFALRQQWLNYIPLARVGVQLFFVLSGFLITLILLKARERAQRDKSRLFEIRQFYARRFLRIFPLYYGIVIAGAIVATPGFREALFWHLSYLTNVYNAITGQWAGVTAHFWTLSVEEQSYVLWLWIVVFAARRCCFGYSPVFSLWGLVSIGFHNLWLVSLGLIHAHACLFGRVRRWRLTCSYAPQRETNRKSASAAPF